MDVIADINRLLDLDDAATTGTSMRIPRALRDAAALAVEQLGVAASVTELTTTALREALEAVAVRAALDAHYDSHPTTRPDPAEIAVAIAVQDGHPLAGHPDRIHAAYEAMRRLDREPTPRNILVWAEAQAAVV